MEQYTHRIGRTGRQGAKGWAYTLFTDADRQLAPGLVALLQSCQQDVVPALRKLDEQQQAADTASGLATAEAAEAAAAAEGDDSDEEIESLITQAEAQRKAEGGNGDDGEGESESEDEDESEDEGDAEAAEFTDLAPEVASLAAKSPTLAALLRRAEGAVPLASLPEAVRRGPEAEAYTVRLACPRDRASPTFGSDEHSEAPSISASSLQLMPRSSL